MRQRSQASGTKIGNNIKERVNRQHNEIYESSVPSNSGDSNNIISPKRRYSPLEQETISSSSPSKYSNNATSSATVPRRPQEPQHFQLHHINNNSNNSLESVTNAYSYHAGNNNIFDGNSLLHHQKKQLFLSSEHMKNSNYIEDPNILYRKPLAVPDSKYRSYLLGQHNKKKDAALNAKCFASFCSIFSGIAALFLLWVAILVDRQPVYIKGVMPKIVDASSADGKTTVLFELSNNERLPSSSNAYYAALAYFFTFLACVYYRKRYSKEERKKSNYCHLIRSKLRQRYYQTIPDIVTNPKNTNESSTVISKNEIVVDNADSTSILPTFHRAPSLEFVKEQQPLAPANTAYQLSVWNRFVAVASSSSLKLRQLSSRRKGNQKKNNYKAT